MCFVAVLIPVTIENHLKLDLNSSAPATMAKLLLFSETSQDPALIIPATNTEKTLHLSYRALHNVVVKAQIRLAALGIAPGSTVALAIRNRIEFVIIFLALIRQGATTSPLNPDCSVRESSEILGYMTPTYTIVAANHYSATSDKNIIEGSELQSVPVAQARWDRTICESLLLYTRVHPISLSIF